MTRPTKMSSQNTVRIVAGQKLVLPEQDPLKKSQLPLIKVVGTLNKIRCDKCDLAFSDLQILQSHKIQVHHETVSFTPVTSPKAALYECDECDKTLQTIDELTNHKSEHEDDIIEDKDYQSEFSCGVCDQSFPNILYLKSHIDTEHDFNSLGVDSCDSDNNSESTPVQPMVGVDLLENGISISSAANVEVKEELIEESVDPLNTVNPVKLEVPEMLPIKREPLEDEQERDISDNVETTPSSLVRVSFGNPIKVEQDPLSLSETNRVTGPTLQRIISPSPSKMPVNVAEARANYKKILDQGVMQQRRMELFHKQRYNEKVQTAQHFVPILPKQHLQPQPQQPKQKPMPKKTGSRGPYKKTLKKKEEIKVEYWRPTVKRVRPHPPSPPPPPPVNELAELKCSMCFKKFKSKFALIKHKPKHFPHLQIHVCKYCLQIFTNGKKSLDRHIANEHEEELNSDSEDEGMEIIQVHNVNKTL